MSKNKCDLCGATWRDGLIHRCSGKAVANLLTEAQDAATILTSTEVDWPYIIRKLGQIISEIEENDAKL